MLHTVQVGLPALMFRNGLLEVLRCYRVDAMEIAIASQEFCDYSKYILGHSKRTIKRYSRIIHFYCKTTNVWVLEDVNENNLRALFYYGRGERGWKPATFISCHNALHVFLRWCKNKGYIEKNFVADIEKPKLEKSLPPKLTKQEAMMLLEVVYNYPYDYTFLRYRNYAIFATFVYAGLRRSELLNLLYTDVDLENLTLFVRLGKGNKDRAIPINMTLAQILRRYVQERKRLMKTCPHFFVSLNRNCGFTEVGLKNLVNKIRTGCRIKFNIHKLRHTFATLMLEGGCDIYSLSKMMGHSDIKTTTIYLYASVEHLRSQIMKHPLDTFKESKTVS